MLPASVSLRAIYRERGRLGIGQARTWLRAMPELPEVETVRRGLAPYLEGARIDKRHPQPQGSALSLPARLCQGARRPDHRRRRPPRQIPAVPSLERQDLARPSGHDRRLPLRRRQVQGALALLRAQRRPKARPCGHAPDPSRARASSPSSIPTPAASASWTCSRDEADSPFLAGLGPEPLGNAVQRRGDGRALQRQVGAHQGCPPRPARRRRAGQYLCQRSALARPYPPDRSGQKARPQIRQTLGAARAPRRRRPRRAQRRHRRRRLDAARFPGGRRRQRAISSTASTSTTAKASPATPPAAPAPSSASSSPAARPSTARSARSPRRSLGARLSACA